MSGPPSSGPINPNPFSSNHVFTMPRRTIGYGGKASGRRRGRGYSQWTVAGHSLGVRQPGSRSGAQNTGGAHLCAPFASDSPNGTISPSPILTNHTLSPPPPVNLTKTPPEGYWAEPDRNTRSCLEARRGSQLMNIKSTVDKNWRIAFPCGGSSDSLATAWKIYGAVSCIKKPATIVEYRRWGNGRGNMWRGTNRYTKERFTWGEWNRKPNEIETD